MGHFYLSLETIQVQLRRARPQAPAASRRHELHPASFPPAHSFGVFAWGLITVTSRVATPRRIAIHLVPKVGAQRCPAASRTCARKTQFWKSFAKFINFSAVSKPNFASEHSFRSVVQALQGLRPFAPLHNLEKTLQNVR